MNGGLLARLAWLVLPALCIGLFARVYYTPDEPREASLAVAMASQADRALPELAGRTFAEKPPLLYWLGAASVSVFPSGPAASRVPNLAYALLAVLAIASLARRAGGDTAGLAAGVAVATMLQLYQGLIWLATDAPLIAGVALALEGMHRGLVAGGDRERLVGYLTMHAGLALAFFAKGFAGWMVPVFAMGTVIVLERRWRELVRPALWAGVPLLGLAIGLWVLAVARRPDGAEALKVLFWYNLVGRAVAIDAPRAYAYATGHANSPGKYLLELPMYLLPWTFIAFAALKRLVPTWLAPGGTAVRLALGAIVPASILLSLAATARGVYYTPPLLGFALLVGLYVGGGIGRWPGRLTAGLIAFTALLAGGVAVLACWAPAGRTPFDLALGALALGGTIAILAVTHRAARAPDGFARQALATSILLALVLGPLYWRLNGWLSLEATATRIAAAAGEAPLVILNADETTMALAHLYLGRTRFEFVEGDAAGLARVRAATDGHARVLWQVPGSGRWDSARWRHFLGYGGVAPAAGDVKAPPGLEGLALVCRIERAGGRTYALFAAATSAEEGPCP